MKRYLALILTVFMFLLICGCEDKKEAATTSNTQAYGEVVINEPADNTVNGYRNDNISTPISDTTYYGNKNSKKFHKSDCKYAKDIKAENCYKTNSRDELILKGYTPCKNCNP